MIMINVTGQTYQIKETLKRNGFQWNPDNQCWWKLVGVGLNATLEAIRPEIAKIQVTLSSVDINGKQMSEKVLRIDLKPGGEREGTDFYAEFQKGICDDVQVITHNRKSPSPPDPEKKDKQKPKHVDSGFF